MDKFIQKIVKEAGDAVLKRFGKVRAEKYKSKNKVDAVTSADLLSEKILLNHLKKRYPTHGIISEEKGSFNTDAEFVWTIDPIDGTYNFSSNVPLFGVMISLMHKQEVILAAIYLPVTQEYLFAKIGKGAFLNGRRIFSSKESTLGQSAGCVSSSPRTPEALTFFQAAIENMKTGKATLNAFGCIATTCRFVAAGERDWMVTTGGKIHDFAPLSLILSEAGCIVTGVDGKKWHTKSLGLVAAPPKLHPQLMKIVRKGWKIT